MTLKTRKNKKWTRAQLQALNQYYIEIQQLLYKAEATNKKIIQLIEQLKYDPDNDRIRKQIEERKEVQKKRIKQLKKHVYERENNPVIKPEQILRASEIITEYGQIIVPQVKNPLEMDIGEEAKKKEEEERAIEEERANYEREQKERLEELRRKERIAIREYINKKKTKEINIEHFEYNQTKKQQAASEIEKKKKGQGSWTRWLTMDSEPASTTSTRETTMKKKKEKKKEEKYKLKPSSVAILMDKEETIKKRLQKRNQAFQTIEKDTTNLAEAAVHFANIVNEQGEHIYKVEATVENSSHNVRHAQKRLKKLDEGEAQESWFMTVMKNIF